MPFFLLSLYMPSCGQMAIPQNSSKMSYEIYSIFEILFNFYDKFDFNSN